MTWWVAIICALIAAGPPSFICWLTWRDVRGVKFQGEASGKQIADLIALLSKKRSKKKG